MSFIIAPNPHDRAVAWIKYNVSTVIGIVTDTEQKVSKS